MNLNLKGFFKKKFAKNSKLQKNFPFFLFLSFFFLFNLVFFSMNAFSAQNQVHPFFFSFYNQNIFYPNNEILNEDRTYSRKNIYSNSFYNDFTFDMKLPLLFISENLNFEMGLKYTKDIDAYQYLSPFFGLRYRFRPFQFWLESRYTFVNSLSFNILKDGFSQNSINNKENEAYLPVKNYWDPRLGFSFSDYQSFFDILTSNSQEKRVAPFFLDTYLESVFIPRLQNLPATTFQTKWGQRYLLKTKLNHSSLYIDPYLELWTRLSPLKDFGADRGDLRLGLRFLIYKEEGLSFLLQGHHSFYVWRGTQLNFNPQELLLIVSGEFK